MNHAQSMKNVMKLERMKTLTYVFVLKRIIIFTSKSYLLNGQRTLTCFSLNFDNFFSKLQSLVENKTVIHYDVFYLAQLKQFVRQCLVGQKVSANDLFLLARVFFGLCIVSLVDPDNWCLLLFSEGHSVRMRFTVCGVSSQVFTCWGLSS